MRGSKREGPSAPALRKDSYEIFCVSMDASDQEIKTVYRKLALKSLLVRDMWALTARFRYFMRLISRRLYDRMLGAIFPGVVFARFRRVLPQTLGYTYCFLFLLILGPKLVWTLSLCFPASMPA